MKFGYKASAEQFGPRELLDFSVQADDAGFDSIWVSDHFQPWRHNGGHAPFALSWLAAAAERTKHAIIGTSVLTPTFRYHPSVIAQAFATLGVLYPGRIALGVGTGESLNEVSASAMKWPPPGERTRRLKESMALVRALWSDERVNFDGEYYKTLNATIYDRPEQMVPIYIAAAGPMMAKYAGSFADGFICTSGKPAELYTETLLPKLAEGIGNSGRKPGAIDRMIEIKLSFDSDLEHARESTRYWGALALRPEEKMDVHDPIEMERLADALSLERVMTRWIVTDDPAVVVDDLRPYVEMGFTHLVFHAPGADQERFLQQFSKHVAPLLRREFGQACGA